MCSLLTAGSIPKAKVMLRRRDAIFAFVATLIAICYLATVAAILAAKGQYTEALGMGGVLTGLIGVIGTMRPRELPQRPSGSDDNENQQHGN